MPGEGFVRNARYGSRIARPRRAILLLVLESALGCAGLSLRSAATDPAFAGSVAAIAGDAA
jgi:hypothetical protein